jgi:hypothetical protein
MTSRLRVAHLLLGVGATVILCSCGDEPAGPEAPEPAVVRVEVTPAIDSVWRLGETVQFSALAKDTLGEPVADLSFQWLSSNVRVASVDSTGLATALRGGQSAITAVAGSVAGWGVLTVEIPLGHVLDWTIEVEGRDLLDVWAALPTDVFAVGRYGTVLYFDGVSWRKQQAPTTEDLCAVWGSSPTDVFAVGYGTIVHYDERRLGNLGIGRVGRGL